MNWSDKTYKILNYYGRELTESYCHDADDYVDEPGSFSIALYKGVNKIRYDYFFTCREQFRVNFKKSSKSILYSVSNAKQARKVCSLLNKVEDHLSLENSQCGMTSFRRVMWISLNKWWVSTNIKREFLSACLRAGLSFDGRKNILNNLSHCDYLDQTKKATELFISGKTKLRRKYVNNMNNIGWYDLFHNGVGCDDELLKPMPRYRDRNIFTILDDISYLKEDSFDKILVK